MIILSRCDLFDLNYLFAKILIIGFIIRAVGAVGSAPDRHSGGHWFEPSTAQTFIKLVGACGKRL